jgi:hypothetical protein
MRNKFGLSLKNNLHGYIVMLVLFAGSLVFYNSFQFNGHCGDLGLKIGAARLQAQGKEAFFITEPNGNKVLNGVTSTPFLNLMHAPLIALNSCQVKQANFWINFVLLFGCLFFAAWLTKKAYWIRIYLLAFVIGIVFIFSRPFYFNLQSGQVYLLYSLIFFVLVFLLQKKQYLLFGIIWAFAIALRPIFLAGTILVFLYFNRKIIAGLFAGALLVVLITVISGTAGYWKEYSTAMKGYRFQMPCDMGVNCENWAMQPLADSNTYSDCKVMVTPAAAAAKKFLLRSSGASLSTLQILLLGYHKYIANINFYYFIAGLLVLSLSITMRLRFKEIPAEKWLILILRCYEK